MDIEENSIVKYAKLVFSIIGAVFSFLFMLISLPALPVIVYLTILFQVIKLMWGKLKEL